MRRKFYTRLLLLSVSSVILLSGVSASHGGFDDSADPSIGNESAEVTMEIWCDFQGPFCKEFFEETFPQIKDNYVDHGDLKVVFKDNPLENMHPWSTEAATVMECVHRQDDSTYYNTLKTVYQNQDSIENETVEENVIDYAVEKGASESEIEACLSENPRDEVLSDREEAESMNISATPTIILGDQRIEGAKGFEEFDQAISSEFNDTEDNDENHNETEEDDSSSSETDPEDLEERLDNESDSNVTALKERLEEQDEEIEELKEQQNTIVSILGTIMDMLGL